MFKKEIIIFLLISILFINKSMQTVDIVKCFECEVNLSQCMALCFKNPATVIPCGNKCEEDHLACLDSCVNVM